jgi:hypothetical protein
MKCAFIALAFFPVPPQATSQLSTASANLSASVDFSRPRNRLNGLIRYALSYRRSIQSFRPNLLYTCDHGAMIYIPCRLKTSKIFAAHLLHLDSHYIQELEQGSLPTAVCGNLFSTQARLCTE